MSNDLPIILQLLIRIYLVWLLLTRLRSCNVSLVWKTWNLHGGSVVLGLVDHLVV